MSPKKHARWRERMYEWRLDRRQDTASYTAWIGLRERRQYRFLKHRYPELYALKQELDELRAGLHLAWNAYQHRPAGATVH